MSNLDFELPPVDVINCLPPDVKEMAYIAIASKIEEADLTGEGARYSEDIRRAVANWKCGPRVSVENVRATVGKLEFIVAATTSQGRTTHTEMPDHDAGVYVAQVLLGSLVNQLMHSQIPTKVASIAENPVSNRQSTPRSIKVYQPYYRDLVYEQTGGVQKGKVSTSSSNKDGTCHLNNKLVPV